MLGYFFGSCGTLTRIETRQHTNFLRHYKTDALQWLPQLVSPILESTHARHLNALRRSSDPLDGTSFASNASLNRIVNLSS